MLSGSKQQVQQKLRADRVEAGENAHYYTMIALSGELHYKPQVILRSTEYKVHP